MIMLRRHRARFGDLPARRHSRCLALSTEYKATNSMSRRRSGHRLAAHLTHALAAE